MLDLLIAFLAFVPCRRSDEADPLRDLYRTRPRPLDYVGSELDDELRHHLRKGRTRRAINVLREAMNWDKERAKSYLHNLQLGRAAKANT